MTPRGEPRHYGVAMIFDDGTVKAARYRAVPDGAAADSFHLSMVKGRMTTGSSRSKPAAAEAVAPRAARPPPSPPPAEDPLEARKRAQRQARERATAATPSPEPARQPPPSTSPA